MKTNTLSLQRPALLIGLIAGALSAAAFGETIASTKPVGLMSVTIPAAVDESTPSNTTLSIPLYRGPDFSSLVASVDGTDLFTLSSAAWTLDQFADVAAPRLVRVKASATASHVGRYFRVIHNTAGGQLQVIPPSGVSIAALVSVGDSCEVVPANTLGTLFGTVSTSFGTGATSAAADNLQLFNGTAWDTYYHNGSSWVKDGDLNPVPLSQNDVVVFPDNGVFVFRRLTTPLTLTFAGAVPTTVEQSYLAAAVGGTPGVTVLALRFQMDTTLTGLGLNYSPNWTSGSSATVADNVLLWNGTDWDIYYFTGQVWKKAGKTGDRGATPIPANSAIEVIRRSTLPSTLSQDLPYSL